MNKNLPILFESLFNIAYIITIWIIVIKMYQNLHTVQPKNKIVAKLFNLAFLLLAIGDTGHVGFRVIAYLMGGLQTPIHIFGIQISLVGLGMLITAYTVTFFYVILVFIWQFRFKKTSNFFTILLIAAGFIRIILMALPGNTWSVPSVKNQIGFIRNIPLFIQGAGVIILYLISARKTKDTLFRNIAICILLSFAFYLPVILYAHAIPAIGTLMIPKTIAYVLVAIFAYQSLWHKQK